ncbi:MAG: hypothetical protein F6J87_03220 [Spirulina sp. SIO3F2]|nr:hypothetical protein [Spirulina sp. SIO3F2]
MKTQTHKPTWQAPTVQTKRDKKQQSKPNAATSALHLPQGAIMNNITTASESTMPVQAKLTIGEVGDKYEQEADTVAKDVVRQINTSGSASETSASGLQLKPQGQNSGIETTSATVELGGQVQRQETMIQRTDSPEAKDLEDRMNFVQNQALDIYFNNKSMAILQAFADEHFFGENVEFIRKYYKGALDIGDFYSTYIPHSAPKMINIESKTRANIMQKANTVGGAANLKLGDFSKAVPECHKKVIGEICDAFNVMRTEVHKNLIIEMSTALGYKGVG